MGASPMSESLGLNERAVRLCEQSVREASELHISGSLVGAAHVLDFGIGSPGGLRAGLRLAEICLAGLGTVSLETGRSGVWPGPSVTVHTDHPVAACLASQYAGWQVAKDDYFAMCSGPIRAAAGREELFDRIGFRETATVAAGVLEAGKLPTPAVCEELAVKSGVPENGLWLAVAPTASLAGTIQVVARSVETALHKLDHLGFPLDRIRSGWGTAPLPPTGGKDLAALGRTNDAVLYGGEVTLWIHTEDDLLSEVGPRVPSLASSDYGRPFLEIFNAYDRDFYKIDPLLFSPAAVEFVNLKTGRRHLFGKVEPEVLEKSFSG
jgi:methenyltetrahydromethanopterin cyclohydrolase